MVDFWGLAGPGGPGEPGPSAYPGPGYTRKLPHVTTSGRQIDPESLSLWLCCVFPMVCSVRSTKSIVCDPPILVRKTFLVGVST